MNRQMNKRKKTNKMNSLLMIAQQERRVRQPYGSENRKHTQFSRRFSLPVPK